METARDLWVPAVNNHGRFGRWAFLEITDPWDAGNLIRAHRQWVRKSRDKGAASFSSLRRRHTVHVSR